MEADPYIAYHRLKSVVLHLYIFLSLIIAAFVLHNLVIDHQNDHPIL